MKTCQAIETSRDTCEQRECGKPATHTAYQGEALIHFCADCLHECMQDASPDEQATVQEIAP